MTLQQMAYECKDAKIKRMAFEEMERMRKASPFPKDFDYEKAREEALTEKFAIPPDALCRLIE